MEARILAASSKSGDRNLPLCLSFRYSRITTDSLRILKVSESQKQYLPVGKDQDRHLGEAIELHEVLPLLLVPEQVDLAIGVGQVEYLQGEPHPLSERAHQAAVEP